MIDNALKFTPAGETVEVRVASNGANSTVVVTDGGPGLSDEELERVGDRFWRSTAHQNIKGSGLGLSISRALIAAGGGSISYAHHKPHGLRVTVTVPRSRPCGLRGPSRGLWGPEGVVPEPPGYGFTDR